MLIIFSPFFSFAQKRVELGDEALKREQFYQAINYYTDYLNKKKANKKKLADLSFKIGYCYKKLSYPDMASVYFKQAIENNYDDPIVNLYYGESLQMLQKYDTALYYFENFKKLVPNHKFANKGIENIKFTREALKTPTRYQIKIIGALNSGEFDYCPFFEVRNNKKVYFTSTRYTPGHVTVSPTSGDFCSNLFYSELGKDGRWSLPTLVAGQINTSDEEGAACLNRKSNNIYFTRCKHDQKENKGCRIFVVKKIGNGWGQVQEVEIPGIPNNISIGHPAISDDELTLYFVADSLLGGYGGKDIYKVVRDKKNMAFSQPQNLGYCINTEEDEVHPYIRSNGDLYFSSDGHTGMGGFDIFKAKHIKGSMYEVENLGSPINSSHDDFGITFMGMREEGFLSSWRHGGMGKTDLFHFVLPEIKFTVSGKVWDKKTNEAIPFVDIQIMNEEYVLMDVQSTNEFGEYEVELKPENNYIIFFKAQSYSYVEKAQVDTKGIVDTKHFTRDIFFEKK
jgi:peptidoglycan-associated lipoprotein